MLVKTLGHEGVDWESHIVGEGNKTFIIRVSVETSPEHTRFKTLGRNSEWKGGLGAFLERVRKLFPNRHV